MKMGQYMRWAGEIAGGAGGMAAEDVGALHQAVSYALHFTESTGRFFYLFALLFETSGLPIKRLK